MRNSHALISVLALSLAACVQTPPPGQLAPKAGPKGHIRVLYDGGLLRRRATADFSVEKSAYAMVAHLGGDGTIRVLYPESPRSYGWTRSGTTYRTAPFGADYDGFPGYYYLSSTRYRGLAARRDSYDGRGNGFVFLITSNRPLRHSEISEFGLWDEVGVENHQYSHDPRLAVREFAELVARGSEYSVEFANAFTSYGFSTRTDYLMDCAMLSSLYFLPMWAYSPWSYGWYGGFRANRMDWGFDQWGGNSCGTRAYASNYWRPTGVYAYAPSAPRLPTPVNETPQRKPRPTLVPTTPVDRRAPGRRDGGTLSYRPTWRDNPSYAPPAGHRTSPRRSPGYPSTPAGQHASRWNDAVGRADRTVNRAPTSAPSGGTSTAAAPAPAPTPTMAPAPPAQRGEPPARRDPKP